MLNRISALACVASTALFACGTVSAATYNLQSDLAANAAQAVPVVDPAGPFSLGNYTSGTFNQATYANFTILDESAAAGMDYFKNAGSDPNFIFNDTGTAQTIASFTLQPNEIGVGPASGPTVARFVVPQSGTYQVNAGFFGIQNANTDAHADIFVNTTAVANGSGLATSSGFTYADSLNLLAGDTVDFVTSNIGGGNRTTRLTVSLTTVPEPASLGLLGLAVFSVIRRRR